MRRSLERICASTVRAHASACSLSTRSSLSVDGVVRSRTSRNRRIRAKSRNSDMRGAEALQMRPRRAEVVHLDLVLGPNNTAKADVAHACVDHLRAPCGGSIPEAIGVGTEVRPALEHSARDLEVRLSRVVAVVQLAATGVERHAARVARIDGALDVPVARPLPDVSRHVVEAVTV